MPETSDPLIEMFLDAGIEEIAGAARCNSVASAGQASETVIAGAIAGGRSGGGTAQRDGCAATGRLRAYGARETEIARGA